MNKINLCLKNDNYIFTEYIKNIFLINITFHIFFTPCFMDHFLNRKVKCRHFFVSYKLIK